MFAIVTLACSLAAAQANIVTRDATGEAAIVNKDEAKAFEDAKALALRNAVEQAAGVRIDADSLVVNNQLVRDQVFSNTSGYVKSFEVTGKKVEKGVVSVTVKAAVITDNLDKDITAAQDLIKRAGRPSIVIIVQEQTVPVGDKTVINSDVVATVLTEAFKADGWDIKDPQAINKAIKLDPSVGAAGAKTIGDLTKANFVLYGRASLRHAEPDSMLKGAQIFPVSGEYNLAIAATDSELQLAKVAGKLEWKADSKVSPLVSYERTAFGLLQDRRREIVDSVRKAVLEHFRNELMNGRRLNVAVSGLDSFTAAKDFQKSIATIKGVREATQDTFANGKAT
ncbi:MAG: hypothetical protein MUC96_34020, partial [Myxococcaceae bacterium]|nr:hypothetical protein [Myxococcaceae bacterium]